MVSRAICKNGAEEVSLCKIPDKTMEQDMTMEKTRDVIIADTLDGLGTDRYADYLAHALCTEGSCRFVFNGKEFELREGDLMIVRKGKLVEGICPSADFRVRVVYVTAGFIELSTPQSNYGMKGQLALFLNPVMRLDAGQQARCRRNFDLVAGCVADEEHHFYRDMLLCAVQMMILDFFDFHSHLYDEGDLPLQSASIMSRFLGMLEDGEFRRHREVGYYADRLCVSPKYLSEVSRNVSGYAANFWINRYTALDIARQLRDKSLTLTDIADSFGFSSPAHFSRYVQQHLGMPPSVFRKSSGA